MQWNFSHDIGMLLKCIPQQETFIYWFCIDVDTFCPWAGATIFRKISGLVADLPLWTTRKLVKIATPTSSSPIIGVATPILENKVGYLLIFPSF